jgi:hypothetical protein
MEPHRSRWPQPSKSAFIVHLAHEVGGVGAKRRVRASRTTLTRVAQLPHLPHCVGGVYGQRDATIVRSLQAVETARAARGKARKSANERKSAGMHAKNGGNVTGPHARAADHASAPFAFIPADLRSFALIFSVAWAMRRRCCATILGLGRMAS